MGSPAKVVRMLTEEQISSNRLSALEYLEMAKSLMSGE
jgi:carbonic anhydrase/acetyltransferase-like protein (isoleucine patch superfamily)